MTEAYNKNGMGTSVENELYFNELYVEFGVMSLV